MTESDTAGRRRHRVSVSGHKVISLFYFSISSYVAFTAMMLRLVTRRNLSFHLILHFRKKAFEDTCIIKEILPENKTEGDWITQVHLVKWTLNGRQRKKTNVGCRAISAMQSKMSCTHNSRDMNS